MTARELSLKPSNFLNLVDSHPKTIGITGVSNKIGDSLVFSALPENYTLNTGRKLVDVSNHRIFDHNPFILRNQGYDILIDLHRYCDQCERNIFLENSREAAEKLYNSFFSIIDKVNYFFGLYTYVRSPRLYFPLTDIVSDNISIHANGLSSGAIPNHVLDFIVNRFSNRTLFQVGGGNDALLPISNGIKVCSLGESFWQMVETISKTSLFIGPSSGPLHIANCFDHIRKKVILTNNKQQLLTFKPHAPFCGADFSVWTDYGWEYYNCYDWDIGITKSFLKM